MTGQRGWWRDYHGQVTLQRALYREEELRYLLYLVQQRQYVELPTTINLLYVYRQSTLPHNMTHDLYEFLYIYFSLLSTRVFEYSSSEN